MKNDQLLQYIASLSEEERVKYKAFIDDAVERDIRLEESYGAARKHVENFADSMRFFMEQALLLQSSLSALDEKLFEFRDAARIAAGLLNQGPVWN